ncbi:MAG: hypothetical protein IH840_18595, partial [Candidatus Heimdallarchaeota archaeon]|nr:hypothetical protein [Candidatus Heimdallarchaeota archaeon]
ELEEILTDYSSDFHLELIEEWEAEDTNHEEELEELSELDINDWVNCDRQVYQNYRTALLSILIMKVGVEMDVIDKFLSLTNYLSNFSVNELKLLVNYHKIGNDGIQYLRKDQYDEGLECFNEAKDLLNDDLIMLKSRLLKSRKNQIHQFLYGLEKLELQILDEGTVEDYVGVVNRFLNKYNLAIQSHQIARKKRSHSSFYDQYLTELNVGNYYYARKDYPLAIHYYENSEKLLATQKSVPIKKSRVQILHNIALCCLYLRNYDDMFEHATNALNRSNEINDEFLIGYSYEVLGKCSIFDASNVKTQLNFFNKSYRHYMNIKFVPGLAYTLLLISLKSNTENDLKLLKQKLSSSKFILNDNSETVQVVYDLATTSKRLRENEIIDQNEIETLMLKFSNVILQPEVFSIGFMVISKCVFMYKYSQLNQELSNRYLFLCNEFYKNKFKHNSHLTTYLSLVIMLKIKRELEDHNAILLEKLKILTVTHLSQKWNQLVETFEYELDSLTEDLILEVIESLFNNYEFLVTEIT